MHLTDETLYKLPALLQQPCSALAQLQVPCLSFLDSLQRPGLQQKRFKQTRPSAIAVQAGQAELTFFGTYLRNQAPARCCFDMLANESFSRMLLTTVLQRGQLPPAGHKASPVELELKKVQHRHKGELSRTFAS